VAEKGSQASLIEDYCGEAGQCYYTNTVTEVHLAEKASLTHTKIQRESKLAYHVGHLAVKQAAHSQLDSHLFSLGGQWVRSDLTIHLDEPHASCGMNGMYVPFDGQHMDHHTLVRHQAPDCQSVQDYKGIVSGHARAVFNGRVVVAKDAQHTSAKQQNKNLLLSTNAEIDTKPQLEIFADDVVCTHGATVGQLDEEALFYLATRGIEHEEASRYLMQAFMTDNLRAIPNAKLAAWIGDLFNEQIG
jgi:Fe-S cluster assembly protein SufD